MSQRLAHRTSMLSLNSTRGGDHASRPRPSRNCSNCVCSPGLLSRQNRLSSIIAKRMSLRKNSSIGGLTRSNSRASFSTSASLNDSCNKDAKEINTSKRLESLRNEMKEQDISIYVVPSEDEHQSEYVSPKDQRRSFISGFSGSAGVAIITSDPLCMNEVPEGLSIVSTDGRYFAQAEEELDFNWKLLKQGVKGEPSWQEWTVSNAIQMSLDSGHNIKIGLNANLISYNNYLSFQKLLDEELSKAVSKQSGSSSNSKRTPAPPKVQIVPVKQDLIDTIWPSFEKVPKRKLSKLMTLSNEYTGESTADKIARVREHLQEKYAKSPNFVINSLDEIAWLLNMRGFDIQYNPVFYSYFILTSGDDDKSNRNILYCDFEGRFKDIHLDKLTITKYLKQNNIEVQPYEKFYEDLALISQSVKEKNNGSFLLPKSSNWSMVQNLNSFFKLIDSPIELFKAVKNPTEIKNFKVAHSKDGLACIKFFAWLENQLVQKEEMLNETEAALKQLEFRREQKNYIDLSFETISATGSNAAIIHYTPSLSSPAIIDPNKIYLNDSGAQFLEGTTDITRTLHFNSPSKEEIDNYTLVLKGNLAIETLKFPEGTNGYMIDSLARQYLWSKGLDYAHGTSHGVGSFLNVHEGPIGIGFRINYAKHSLLAGNVISNEPGFYKDGEYGIRIENVVYIAEDEDIKKQQKSEKKQDLKEVEEQDFTGGEAAKRSKSITPKKTFFKIINLTRVPYCRKLINRDLLSKEEIALINEYHASIYSEYKKELSGDAVTLSWLKKQCQPL